MTTQDCSSQAYPSLWILNERNFKKQRRPVLEMLEHEQGHAVFVLDIHFTIGELRLYMIALESNRPVDIYSLPEHGPDVARIFEADMNAYSAWQLLISDEANWAVFERALQMPNTRNVPYFDAQQIDEVFCWIGQACNAEALYIPIDWQKELAVSLDINDMLGKRNESQESLLLSGYKITLRPYAGNRLFVLVTCPCFGPRRIFRTLFAEDLGVLPFIQSRRQTAYRILMRFFGNHLAYIIAQLEKSKAGHQHIPDLVRLDKLKHALVKGDLDKSINDMVRKRELTVDLVDLSAHLLRHAGNAFKHTNSLAPRYTRESSLEELCEAQLLNFELLCARSRTLAFQSLDEDESAYKILRHVLYVEESVSIKRLSIIASLFLPLTLAASILNIQTRFKDLGLRLFDFLGVALLIGAATLLIWRLFDLVKSVGTRFDDNWVPHDLPMEEKKLWWRLGCRFGRRLKPVGVSIGPLLLVIAVAAALSGMFADFALCVRVWGYGTAATLSLGAICFALSTWTYSRYFLRGVVRRFLDVDRRPWCWSQGTSQTSMNSNGHRLTGD